MDRIRAVFFKFGTAIMVLIFCIVVITVAVQYVNNSQLQKINSERDTRLDSYAYANQIAESYLQVLNIRDASSYKQVKSALYSNLSADLQSEVFPTEEYEGDKLTKISWKLVESVGEIQNTDTYLFKLTYTVNLSGTTMTKITLILVENGKITNIRTL